MVWLCSRARSEAPCIGLTPGVYCLSFSFSNLILVSFTYMQDAGHLLSYLNLRFKPPMPLVFAQVVAVLIILQLVACSQAAGVLRNITIDNQDSACTYSSGWDVGRAEDVTNGGYLYATDPGEYLFIDLPANTTSLFFEGLTGHTDFIACLDCDTTVGEQTVVVSESSKGLSSVGPSETLFSMTAIDPSRLHTLLVTNLGDLTSGVTFDHLVVTIVEGPALVANPDVPPSYVSQIPQTGIARVSPVTKFPSPTPKVSLLENPYVARRLESSSYPAANPSYLSGRASIQPISSDYSSPVPSSVSPTTSPFSSVFSTVLTLPSSAFPTPPPISSGSSIVISTTLLSFDSSSVFPPPVTSFPVPAVSSSSMSSSSGSISSSYSATTSPVSSSTMDVSSSMSASSSDSSSAFSSNSVSVTSMLPISSSVSMSSISTQSNSESASSISSSSIPSSSPVSTSSPVPTSMSSSVFTPPPSLTPTASSFTPESSQSSSASQSGPGTPAASSETSGTVAPNAKLSTSVIIVVAILSSLAVLSILFGVVMLLLRKRSRFGSVRSAGLPPSESNQNLNSFTPYMAQRPSTPPLPPPPPRGLEPYRNSYTTRFFGGGPPGAVSRPPVPGDPFADSAGGSLGPSASQTRFSLDSTTPPHSYTSPGSTTRVAAWVQRTPRQVYADESV